MTSPAAAGPAVRGFPAALRGRTAAGIPTPVVIPIIRIVGAAAGALAHWNIRRGVAELVELLESKEEMPQPSQLFYVRDNAMRTFRLKNIRKGWGFPDDKESAEWPPDVTPPPDVAARVKPRPTVEEIKKWFAENEHRFPDWRPGDPLPQVSAGDNNKPNKE